MSIQPTSVVRRIVEDARANPRADFVCEVLAPEAFSAEAGRQRISLLRAPLGGVTTQYEFWAHALWAWLGRVGLSERFEPLVGNALCDSVSEAALRRAVATRFEPLRSPRTLALDGGFANAWRMIDQDVLESFAIESERELIAFFWEDLSWL